MPLYEWKHVMDAEYFVVEKKRDFSFPLHIHSCFEILLITEGAMEVMVDNRLYNLEKGDAVLIFPHQIHALHTPVSSGHTLCVFSPDLVRRYATAVGQALPQDNILHLQTDPVYTLFCNMTSQDNLYRVKGILYYLCGVFMDKAVLVQRTPRQSERLSLLQTVLDFIHRNFTEDCTLKRLSGDLKYDYAYLSKFFIASVGIPFNEYVNQLRISHACSLLANTDQGILSIAEASGFSSLRTFNRNFQRYVGHTPREYRQQCRQPAGKNSSQPDGQT